MNRKKGNFRQFLAGKSDPLYTKTYSVECLYIDNSQNMWIGTFSNGVNIVPKHGDAIITYKKFKGGDLSITNNMVNAFFIENKDKIWVGTDGGGINFLNKSTGLFTNWNTKNSNLPSDYILSIVKGNNGKVWMATWGMGLICYNEKTQTFKTYTKENSDIPDNNLFHVAKGFDNDLWLSSYSDGLVHFIPDENKWTSYNRGNSTITDNFINVIRLAENGNLYVGSRSGLMLFNPEQKEFKSCLFASKEQESLSNQHVYDVFVESSTSVWIATLNGLNHYNSTTGENARFTLENGLPSNTIRSIAKDQNGNLWFATSNGVCQFDENNNVVQLFSIEDGLQSNDFRPRSVLSDDDGSLYFGGVNGFNIIYPERIVKNKKIPVVQITGFELFNKVVKAGSENSALKQSISETKELRLRHDQTVLTFHFGVLDYTRPQKNQHAYMLENFDKDWIYCGSRREVTYTNLDPGKYILRIKGANNDGVWNDEGVALSIIIVPPWWATWWFKSIIAATLLVLIVSIYYSRVSALKKQKQILEKTVQVRTNELAEINATKDKLFSIVAHDLRSPFNVILGFTNLLLEKQEDFDKKATRRVLKDLKISGETAFSLLENLLNWSLSQQNEIKFTPEIILVDTYIPKVIDEFQITANKKNIYLVNKSTANNLSVYADFNMLSSVFRNIIANAVKFSNPGTEVWIESKVSENGWVTFCITDHGIGIEKDKVLSLFTLGETYSTVGTNGEKGTGLGLILSKEFIEKHKGCIWVESEKGIGSTFCFSVPGSEKVYTEA